MKLTLQQLTGSKYFLEAEPKDKVREVKVKILKELEIKQKLRLTWQNKEMEDCITLHALGITEDTTIQMLLEPDTKLKLNIQTFKKGKLVIELNHSSTPLDLVDALSTSTLRTTAKVSDFYFGKVHLADENLPLHYYEITDGATIIQKYQGSFNIQLDDAREHKPIGFVKVSGTDTIKTVRENVVDFINRSRNDDQEFKVTENEIVIFHSEKYRKVDSVETRAYNELDRETLTVFEWDIRPADVITFIRYHAMYPYSTRYASDDYKYRVYSQSYSVDIKMTGQKEETYRIIGVYDHEAVQSMRLKIQHQLHIPYENQVLSTTSGQFQNLYICIESKYFRHISVQAID